MKLTYQIVHHHLKEPFKISYGEYHYRKALIISLNHLDQIGYGECIEIDYYNINFNKFREALNFLKQDLLFYVINSPFEFYNFIQKKNIHPFLSSALDCAFWDLYGKLTNKSCLELLDLNYKSLPESSITISINSVKEQIRAIEKLNWNNFKVKVDNWSKEYSNTLLQTKKNIGIDANGSFNKQICKQIELDIDSKEFLFFEQPLEIGYSNFKNLNNSLNANWMADEDLQAADNLEQLKPHYTTINIKVMKCGGITPSLVLIKKAKTLGLKVMIGCMTESSIGISAGAILATQADFIDLDGANLLSNDIAEGSTITNGKLNLTTKPGLGISIK